ncbi:AraC family transcriptional regulator [Streptomyces sp. NPDC005017]|uniref:AraC-like ligand-binding domain-containing protein n=1 Tax=Streptomyces sp. NPDC005017 TaxID=3364706 RepID=UPI00368262EE
MSPVLGTESAPPGDRAELIRHAVWEGVVAVDIDHHPPAQDISARIGYCTVGPLRIFSARSTAATVRRTGQLARLDEEPAVFLGLQVTGTSLVMRNGRQCLLGTSDLAVYESVAPYTLLFEDGVDHHFFRIPRVALALPERKLREVTAVTLGSVNPLARLASPASPNWPSPRRCITARTPRPSWHPASNSSARSWRRGSATSNGPKARWRPRCPCGSPGTSARTWPIPTCRPPGSPRCTASRAGIFTRCRPARASVSGSGSARTAWPRADANWRARTADCGPSRRFGRSWGFVDATHFSKVFGQAYGVSPRAWRDRNHSRPPA